MTASTVPAAQPGATTYTCHCGHYVQVIPGYPVHTCAPPGEWRAGDAVIAGGVPGSIMTVRETTVEVYFQRSFSQRWFPISALTRP